MRLLQLSPVKAILLLLLCTVDGRREMRGYVEALTDTTTTTTTTTSDDGLLKTISVVGFATTSVEPDVATFTAGVSTLGDTAQESLTENSGIMDMIMATLKNDHGIANEHLQTTGFSISPEYDWRTEPATMIGFRTTNNLRIQVYALDDLGTIMDDVVTAGSNTLSGVSFSKSDTSAALEVVRKAAYQDAHARASLYAAEAGVTLGPVVSIQEPGAASAPSRGGAYYAESAMDTSMAVPIASGELDISSTVSVVFAIVPATESA